VESALLHYKSLPYKQRIRVLTKVMRSHQARVPSGHTLAALVEVVSEIPIRHRTNESRTWKAARKLLDFTDIYAVLSPLLQKSERTRLLKTFTWRDSVHRAFARDLFAQPGREWAKRMMTKALIQQMAPAALLRLPLTDPVIGRKVMWLAHQFDGHTTALRRISLCDGGDFDSVRRSIYRHIAACDTCFSVPTKIAAIEGLDLNDQADRNIVQRGISMLANHHGNWLPGERDALIGAYENAVCFLLDTSEGLL